MKTIAPKLVHDFTEDQHLGREQIAFVYSPGLSKQIREEVEMQAKALGFREILWVQTGGVVSTHSGPGAFGVCGFSE